MSTRRRLSWLAMAAVLVVALGVGAFGDRGPSTQQERVYEIAAEVKCPECAGQTAAESDTASSRAMRATIAEGLQQGLSREEILDDLVSSYGEAIVLAPSAEGVTGLVWMIPVVLGVVVVAGLVLVFRRWGRQGHATASDDDEARVADALAARHGEA